MEPKRGPLYLGFVAGRGWRREVYLHRSGAMLLIHPRWLAAK